MKIQVLGSGCPTCKTFYKTVEEIVSASDHDIEVEYDTDITKILELGVMGTPVLVIDGKVVIAGKVPSQKEIESLIFG